MIYFYSKIKTFDFYIPYTKTDCVFPDLGPCFEIQKRLRAFLYRNVDILVLVRCHYIHRN